MDYDDFEDEDGFMFGDEEFDDREDEWRDQGDPVLRPSGMVAVSSNVSRFGLPPGYKQQSTEDLPKKRINTQGPTTIQDGDHILAVDDVKMACMRDDVTIIKRALSQGFPVDSPIHSDWTALMYASHAGSAAALKCLIEAGANVNYEKDRYSVLMAACGSTASNDAAILTCVQCLIDAGADVNAFDRHHVTPLMYAAKQGHASIIRALANADAELNRQDGRGNTALMWAVMKKRVHAVYALLELGASIQPRDRSGSTAQDIAAIEGFTHIQQLLDKHSTLTPTHLTQAEQAIKQEESSAANNSDDTNTTNRQFGDLEMLLSGLGMSIHIPAFHAHHVTLEQLLRMSDNELESIVPQAGVRKRLLESITRLHKKEWEVTSLGVTSGTVADVTNRGGGGAGDGNNRNNKKQTRMSCSEAIFVLQNLKKHSAYMAATVGFIRDNMSEAVLSSAAEGAGAQQLLIHCAEAQKNSSNLLTELRELQNHVMEVDKIAPPPDIIRDVMDVTSQKSSKRGRVKWTYGLILGAVVCVAAYKRDDISNYINNVLRGSN